MSLTEAQRWAIALAMPVRVRVGLDGNSLGGGSAFGWCRRQLRDAAAMEDRPALLKGLETYLAGGQAAEYQALAAWRDGLPRAAGAMGFVILDNTEHLRRAFVVDHAGRPEEASLVAWDVARAAHFATLGYQAGFLVEDEVWRLLARAAKLAQKAYRSWKEYGQGFLYGRWYWAGQFDRAMEDAEKAVKELLRSPNSPWNGLAWDVDVAALEVPERGDPGGPLSAWMVRACVDCPACLQTVLVRSVQHVHCDACGEPLDGKCVDAVLGTALRFRDSEEEDEEEDYESEDDEEDEDDDEDDEAGTGKTEGPKLGTNLGDNIERVITMEGKLACDGCRGPITDADVRGSVGKGAFVCACGYRTAVVAPPPGLREIQPRLRYVVGSPLLGRGDTYLSFLFSET
jgi:hypothetical protein